MFKERQFGEVLEMFLKMAEYLSIHGHERKEVYEYSLKKLVFFFDVVKGHKSKENHDKVVDMYYVLCAVHGNNSEKLSEHLGTFEF